MCESEVQPLIPFIFCSLEIRLLLFLGHAAPDTLSFLILPNIVKLRANEYEEIVRANSN